MGFAVLLRLWEGKMRGIYDCGLGGNGDYYYDCARSSNNHDCSYMVTTGRFIFVQ